MAKDPPTDLSQGLNSCTYSLKAAVFLTVVLNSQKPDALIEVGKERATNKGNKNLRINNKEDFTPLSLEASF